MLELVLFQNPVLELILFQNPVLELALFQNPISKLIYFSFEKPSSDSGFPSNHFFSFEDLSSNSGFPLNYFFFWRTEFRLEFSLKSFSFVDPSSDSWSLYLIRALIRALHFLLLIRVPTRDLSILFKLRFELFIFFCWSGFRLKISLPYSSSNSSSSFSFVDPSFDSRSLYLIQAQIRALHFLLLIRVPTRDLCILFELWLKLIILLC